MHAFYDVFLWAIQNLAEVFLSVKTWLNSFDLTKQDREIDQGRNSNNINLHGYENHHLLLITSYSKINN